MSPETEDPDAWFRAKRFGYGASLPLRWQGWVVLALFLLILLAANLLHGLPRIALQLADIAAFILVTRRHTAGGWAWRWGKD